MIVLQRWKLIRATGRPGCDAGVLPSSCSNASADNFVLFLLHSYLCAGSCSYAYEGLASEGMDKYLVNALDDMRVCSNFSPDARRTANRLSNTVRQMEKLDDKLAKEQAKLDAQSSSTEAEAAPEPAAAAAPPASAPVDDSKKAEAEALKIKGNEAFKKNKFDEAVKHYTAAIEINPDDETYYSNRSGAYLVRCLRRIA